MVLTFLTHNFFSKCLWPSQENGNFYTRSLVIINCLSFYRYLASVVVVVVRLLKDFILWNYRNNLNQTLGDDSLLYKTNFNCGMSTKNGPHGWNENRKIKCSVWLLYPINWNSWSKTNGVKKISKLRFTSENVRRIGQPV